MMDFKSIPFNRLVMIQVGELVVFSLAFAVPNVAVLAVGPTPTPRSPDTSALAKDFQQEQSLLTTQQANLSKAAGATGKVQDLISKAQAKGLDTSALASALATFQSQLTNAQASHAAAEGILAAHNGFDDSGNVTDLTAAAQTVKDANQSLLDAHNTLVQATADMMKVVEQWRDQNQLPTPTPSSTGF